MRHCATPLGRAAVGLSWGGALLGQLLLAAGAAAVSPQALKSAAQAVEDQVIAWRRDIHEHPELSNRETRTAALVAEHLRSLGLEVRTEVAHTGVVGVLQGGKPGPVVALRADMDALPVTERTGLPYSSEKRTTYNGQDVGVMHACGHDTHVAILMGAAEVLAGMREQLPGTVKFIFQPAEEGPPKGEDGGADMMVRQGVLKDPDVDAIFGLHISQGDKVGQMSYRPRGAMASAQRFEIHVQGRQTHGAQPWAGVDPIVVGSHIVTALQAVVSRQADLTRGPAVVTVGTFHAGVRNNIVPDTAQMSGTIRTFDAGMRQRIHEDIERVAVSVAQSMGAEATVEIDSGLPVTYNDEALTDAMLPTLRDVYGADNVRLGDPITGAEDFSFYQEQIPGLFFFIGGRPPEVPLEEAIPNHSPLFYVDEDALVLGVEAMSRLAVDYLSRGGDS
ncbi:MAG: amidohydrolase [Gammaproteobacteria bacterium]|nr:amidohydrolase [Gammaproteobacteria bacterium]